MYLWWYILFRQHEAAVSIHGSVPRFSHLTNVLVLLFPKRRDPRGRGWGIRGAATFASLAPIPMPSASGEVVMQWYLQQIWLLFHIQLWINKI